MGNPLSRRTCMKAVGTGAALIVTGAAKNALSKELAIGRKDIDWSNRPMYLRAYHPPYLVYYYGKRNDLNAGQKTKWGALLERVENEPDLTIRIIEAYDDACTGCGRLSVDPNGSIWGAGYSCPSALDETVAREVTLASRRILVELGLYYGSEIKFRDLVPLLEKNVPVLYKWIGGEDGNQAFYEKGLKDLKKKYML